MRLGWVGNSAWSNSGYGVQTRLFTTRINDLGYPTAVICNHGLEGTIRVQDGIPHYPRGFESLSRDVLNNHLEHFGADAAILLYDAWPYENHGWEHPVAPWFPIDMLSLSDPVKRTIERMELPIAMSRFGQARCFEAGIDAEYVPHGYDGTAYYPDPNGDLRDLCNAREKFMIGVVAANNFQPPRKCWAQIFEAYAAFLVKHPDSVLYIHSLITTQMHGCDLLEMQRHFAIPDHAIMFCDQYHYQIGFPDQYMRQMYSSLDTLLLVSMGEGFGVPLIEAQACGTPVVCGDWTAMSELCKSGVKIPADEAYRVHVPNHTEQYLARPAAITRALEEMLGKRYDRAEVSSLVAAYDADQITLDHWRPVLGKLEELVAPPQPYIRRVA